MAHDQLPNPAHGDDPAVDGTPRLSAVPVRPVTDRWSQPRAADGSYVALERRDLPALTSLRFFAAIYVVVHHLINIGLLQTQGAGADRSATWYLAWGTQGHVGVTFFFVLSGFILAWCYHQAFSTDDAERRSTITRTFWFARFARVWPLHAAMLIAFVPFALSEAGVALSGLVTTAWHGALNLLLLHAWVPTGTADGLSDTCNAPSWTLSVEACFYLLFPLMATLLVARLRWGTAQLALLIGGSWITLGAVGWYLDGSGDVGEWAMRVLPATRLADFVIGVALGLIVVQGLQRAKLRDEPQTTRASTAWTALETFVLVAACASPLVWALGASDQLPATLGSSWFHLPTIVASILVIALERGAISRRLLALRPLVWLGEVSYAMYLTHLFLVLAAYRIGVYDLLGVWGASALLLVAAVVVSGIVHERFEKPARARLVARRARRAQ